MTPVMSGAITRNIRTPRQVLLSRDRKKGKRIGQNESDERHDRSDAEGIENDAR